MTEDSSTSSDRTPAASDVVAPVGDERHKDPATSGSIAAHAGAVPTIEVAEGERTDEGGSIEDQPARERQDADHVGVDWDVTRPPEPLPPIEVTQGERTDEGGSIEDHPGPGERQDADHVGVDWDLTRPQHGEDRG
jgi:hypothetical protein